MTRWIRVSALVMGVSLAAWRGEAQQASQAADDKYNVEVSAPAYVKRHPHVLFDEGHFNVHTSGGSYSPFAKLITNDGYRVVPNRSRLDRRTLRAAEILVIANALGAADPETAAAARSAFSDAEVDAIVAWVRGGGRLLLVTDHEPAATAAESLVTRFGVGSSKNFALDRKNYFTRAGWPGNVTFTREAGLLADHAINNGRNPGERVSRVLTFGGQSLHAPPGATPILKLSDSATTLFAFPARQMEYSAAGRALVLAMRYGRGRVVITGEAAMLSAQLLREGDATYPMGMNVPGFDNRQFALNIMHWLSGLTN
jgi:hypothetical protein